MTKHHKSHRGHNKSMGHRGPRRVTSDGDVDMLGTDPPRLRPRRESYSRNPRGPTGSGGIPSWREDREDIPTGPRNLRGGHRNGSYSALVRRPPPVREMPSNSVFNSDCPACVSMVRLNRSFSNNLRLHLESFFHKLHEEIERWADDVGVGNGRSLDPMDWQMEMTTRIIERERRPSERRCSYMRIVSAASPGGMLTAPVPVPVPAPANMGHGYSHVLPPGSSNMSAYPAPYMNPPGQGSESSRPPMFPPINNPPSPLNLNMTPRSQASSGEHRGPHDTHEQPSMGHINYPGTPQQQEHHGHLGSLHTQQPTPNTIFMPHTSYVETPQKPPHGASYTPRTPQDGYAKLRPENEPVDAHDCIVVANTSLATAPDQFTSYRDTNPGDSFDAGQGGGGLTKSGPEQPTL